jgi:hypothetical protein
MESDERKVHHLMKQLHTMKNDRVSKADAKRKESHAKHLKAMQAKEAVRAERAKEDRKKAFREISIEEKKRNKRQKVSNDMMS